MSMKWNSSEQNSVKRNKMSKGLNHARKDIVITRTILPTNYRTEPTVDGTNHFVSTA